MKMDRGQQTIVWLELLYRLYPKKRLAEVLGIKPETLRRWEQGWKLIDDDLEKRFTRIAQERIVSLLRSDEGIAGAVATQAQRRLNELANTLIPQPALGKKERAKSLIYAECANRTILYSELRNRALEAGVSVSMLNKAAEEMEVDKTTYGRRRAFSMWRLEIPQSQLADRGMSPGAHEMDVAMKLIAEYVPCKLREILEAMIEEPEYSFLTWESVDKAARGLDIWRTGNEPDNLWKLPEDED